MSEHDYFEEQDAPWELLDEEDIGAWDPESEADTDDDLILSKKRANISKSGSNPNKMSMSELSKRHMKVESDYNVYEDSKNQLRFSIKFTNSPLIDEFVPVLYYDGGPHAILVKNEEVTVICDYIHPAVRKSLENLSWVLFRELKDGEILEEYEADVLHVPGIYGVVEKNVPALMD